MESVGSDELKIINDSDLEKAEIMASQNQAVFLSRMTKFSGDGGPTGTVWIRRFELQTESVADEERVKLLIMLLDGKALDVCAGFSTKARKSFKEMKSLMTERFAPNLNQVEAYALLQRARRMPGETLEDFSDRVQELVLLAYPGEKKVLDSVGRSQFLCGLGDELLQRQLLDMELETFREVTAKAVALSRSQATAARLNSNHSLSVLSEGHVASGASVQGEVKTSSSQMVHIQEQLELLTGQVAALSSGKDQGNRQAGRCFHCNEVGHFRRECPRLETTRPRDIRCFRCGEKGHMQRECPSQGFERARGGFRQQPTDLGRCIFCGRVGHFMSRCTEWGQMARMMGTEGLESGLNPRVQGPQMSQPEN